MNRLRPDPSRLPALIPGCFLALLLLAGLSGTPAANAQDSPGTPIQLDADQAELDGKRGIGIYTGNVILTQGNREITGERMTVHTRNGRELDHVVVEGSPATWRESPTDGREEIRGQAPRMEYHAGEQERVLLLEGGRVEQGRNTFTGETIEYDLASERVIARGRDQEQRIRVTLFPDENDNQ